MADENVGTHLTGEEDQSIDELVRRKIAEQQQKQQQAGADGPIEIDLFGKKYKFENQAQLSAAINNLVTAYQQELQAKREAEAREQVAGQHLEADEPPPFDPKTFADLMIRDPIKAMDYLDSYRFFGGREERPAEVIRQHLGQLQSLQATLAAYQFKEAHPEVNFLPPDKVADVINSLRTQLGLPFTLDGLEAAYGVAQQRGLLPSRETVVSWVRQQIGGQKAAASGGAEPGMPSIGRGTGGEPQVTLESLYQMPLEKLEEILKSVGKK